VLWSPGRYWLLTALKRMNENYDVKGSVHTLEQRRPRKYRLDHLPNRQSFDLEFSPTRQILQQTAYTNSEGIYRSSRFAYDDTGRLTRIVESDGTGKEFRVSEFEYSLRRRTCTTRNATGIMTGLDVDEYDENKLLTLLGSYDADGKPKRLKSFKYSNSKLVEAVSKFYVPDGSLVEISISRFDSLGRIVEAFGLTPDGKPLGDGRYVYEYDGEGRKHKILSFNDLDETDVPGSIRGFTYKCDEIGNWTERTEYYRSRGDSDWTKKVTTRRLTYFPLDDS
jgi:hypothetical protein